MRKSEWFLEKGLNSDILYNGSTFHIQTEDWGFSNPFIVTQVFQGGKVVKLVKIPYTQLLPRTAVVDPKTVRYALETQHHSILDMLVSGKIF